MYVYTIAYESVSNVHMLPMIWLVLMGCFIVLRLGKSYTELGVIFCYWFGSDCVPIVQPGLRHCTDDYFTRPQHQTDTGGITSTNCKEFRDCSHNNQYYAAKKGQVLFSDHVHLNILGAQLLTKEITKRYP